MDILINCQEHLLIVTVMETPFLCDCHKAMFLQGVQFELYKSSAMPKVTLHYT